MSSQPLEHLDAQASSAAVTTLEALNALVDALQGQPREGQQQMAAAVARALAYSSHALIQAGTGTGKSAAYLMPSALYAQASRSKVIISTATLALQRQLMDRELPAVSAVAQQLTGQPLRFALLKGRGNYLCLLKFNEHTDEPTEGSLPTSTWSEQASRIRQWAEDTSSGDRDDLDFDVDSKVWSAFSVGRRECLESRCPFLSDCFVTRRRAEAEAADLVVTNHAMLAVEFGQGIPVLPEHSAVIVDEAHELPERIAAAAAFDLTPGALTKALNRARACSASYDLVQQLETATWALADTLSGILGLENLHRMRSIPGELSAAIDAYLAAAHAVVNSLNDAGSMKEQSYDQYARATLLELSAGLDRVQAGVFGDVYWLESSVSGTVLKTHPTSVADVLANTMLAGRAVVLTSATAAPNKDFTPLAADLGLDLDATLVLDAPSPFDYPKQGILYVASHLPPPTRDGMSSGALEEAADLIEAAGGRTLGLFSSWRAVDAAADFLKERLGKDYPILVQRRGEPPSRLVEAFRQDPRSTLIGTMSLWQGVDVPGDSCTLVLIDRLPFPRPDDPVLQARSELASEAGLNPFAQVSIPRAGLLLAQGTGRLIRTTGDRGVVAVLDSRLANSSYGPVLREYIPDFWYTTNPEGIRRSLRALDSRLQP